MFYAGWVITLLPAALLVFSATMKFLQPGTMRDDFEKSGWPGQYLVVLGVVELTSTLIYLFPRTAVLGATLLTGYLGGAVATHARLADPKFAIPVLVGVLVWLGLFLRDPRIRALTPWRS